MRTFRCACGARIFFENQACLACGRELGFLPDALQLTAIEPDAENAYRVADDAGRYRKCANYAEHGVCNWMVAAGDAQPLCLACRLNNVIPDLGDPESRERWAKVESAKRRLVYSLLRLGLPLVPKSDNAENGVAFDLKTDAGDERVLTGHADGLITLNATEADPVTLEQARVAMKERYRTLLGHFRHEIGHHFWDRLVRDTPHLDEFRRLFGDERADYGQALQQHYGSDAVAASNDQFISHYAGAHPWEDWAETFAHYLHIVDTLDTARNFDLTTSSVATEGDVSVEDDFGVLLDEWHELTIAMNALSRSMGLEDAYPFVISPAVREKLAFVHSLVRPAARM
jgi:hypothetical protein